METEKPGLNVHIVQDSKPGLSPVPKLAFKSWFGPKAIFLVLGIVILVELFIGVRSIVKSPRKAGISVSSQLAPVTVAKIALVSDKSNYQKGETIPLSVRLFTGGHSIIATDAVIKYDPNVFEATGSGFFEQGDIFDDYPGFEVDSKLGIVRVSGILLNVDEGFNGTGEIATLNFKAKKDGSTKLSVDYTPSSTIDSNIIEGNTTKDILGEVMNLDLTIGGGSSQDVNKDTNTCSGFSQTCIVSEIEQGVQTCKGGRTKNNVCNWDPKLTQDCGDCEAR